MTANHHADAEPTREMPLASQAPETQVLPESETTQTLPKTEPTDATQALPVAPAQGADQPAATQAPETAWQTAMADESDVEAVWSASTLAHEPTEPRDLDRPRGPRATTVMWGTFLLACGLLTIILGLGTHIDLTVVSIVVLAATGLSLLLVALIPQRSDAPQ